MMFMKFICLMKVFLIFIVNVNYLVCNDEVEGLVYGLVLKNFWV